ncbi:Eaa protein [Escherichia coli]|nr:Eaa protein [Escherichia coli]
MELSRDKIKEIINDDWLLMDDCEGNKNCDVVKEMARIALASLEAEPVAWLLSGGGAKNNVSFDSGNAYADPLREVTPLYTAPPAPVSVPAAMEIDDDFDSAFEHGKAVGWNAYRAAMLQAEPVSNSDELPLDYLQGHKDGLEWAAQQAEANHPQTGDWLYDDPIELARAIRKGPDIPEFKSVSVDEDDNFYSWFGRFWYENYQKNNYTTSAKQMLGTMAEFAYRAGRESAALAGNSPVIPDGWISCSDRMPEDTKMLLAFSQGKIVAAYWNWVVNPIDYKKYRAFTYLSGYILDDVTHWMPLPEPPQEAK